MKSNIRIACVTGTLAALLVGVPAHVQTLDAEIDHGGFTEIAVPFLQENCQRCHGPDEVNGDLRMDRLSAEDFLSRARAARWEEILSALNGYQMPPQDEPQPDPEAAGQFSDWVLAQLAAAERARAPAQKLVRRLNRNEYNNTLRTLLGIEQSVGDDLPLDGTVGGFDNNGGALSVSPLHIELYYEAALQALDYAIEEGREPRSISWRFDPEENTRGEDRLRVDRDGNGIYLNPGNNRIDGEWTHVRAGEWDTSIGFRQFELPAPGTYVLRIRAFGNIPTRESVVAAVADLRGDAADLAHFREHPAYHYGPPRVRVTQTLGGQPKVIAEFDIDAPQEQPQVYEIEADYTTENAGISIEYIYNLPEILENFSVRKDERFPVPSFALDWIELEGPVHRQWPPASHVALLGEELPRSRDEVEHARGVLQRFMQRAYRRPVTDAEVEARVAMFVAAREDADSYLEAIRVPLAAVLASPHFLFLVEQPADTHGARLSAWELASRLSYFLWSDMPDEALFAAAADNSLLEPSRLLSEVDRMLADPRSAAFVRDFAGQWLGLRELGANPPVPNLYPRYDRHLELSMAAEAQNFFAEILHNDLSVSNFISSDFVVINERLARFYEIPDVRGDYFRRVPVTPQSHRGGLLTQAAMLSVTSNGTRTSPVLRGVWVLRTLLAADPGLPVANVGEIAPNIPGLDKATVRQRLEMHRSAPQCARCHNRIDPLGLALENFDASGAWRSREGFGWNGRVEENDPLVDARVQLADGTRVDGPAGLKQSLLAREDEFRSALAQALLRYALGRTLGYADRSLVGEVAAARDGETTTLRAMIHTLVASETFRSR